MTKHKHYDCIVAWAEGKKIETRETFQHEWRVIENPSWSIGNEYRIKKEPVIEVKYFEFVGGFKYLRVIPDLTPWHLKITYQDGKAVKVELPE